MVYIRNVMFLVKKGNNKLTKENTNKKSLSEERKKLIIQYIQENVDKQHTKYSLSKNLNIPLKSVQLLINEMAKNGIVSLKSITENNVTKSLISIKSEENNTIDLPVDNSYQNLINEAIKNNFRILIHHKDDTITELVPPTSNNNTT